MLDLAWVVAGAAGPRVLAGLGAEVIRVEWKGRYDTVRTSGGIPVGEERERVLRGETLVPSRGGVNQGSVFAEVNPGKRSIGLNLGTPRGVELLHELVRISDVVVENFTARKLEEFGATYESMRAVNPSIIYVQQPGFGRRGRYDRFLSSAPVGEAFSGLTEMAGLPTPYPPSGWGYLYLDWSASYYCAMAMLAALYHRERTGEGQYIDGSLGEPGLLLTGTAMLDHQVNGRAWQRTGNRSPYKPACPHGAYRCRGDDRWIAIAVFDDAEWRALAGVLGDPEWMRQPRFAELATRLKDPQEIDSLLQEQTRGRGRFRADASAAGRRRGGRRLPDGRGPRGARPPAAPRRVPGPAREHRGGRLADPPVPREAVRDPVASRRNARAGAFRATPRTTSTSTGSCWDSTRPSGRN